MTNDKLHYKMHYEEVLRDVGSQREGLTEEKAQQRLREYGSNEIQEKKPRTIFEMFLSQFKDVMVIILIIAAVISGFLGEKTDALIIMLVVIINSVLGVFQENKAEKALAELKKMSSPYCKVRRDGEIKIVETSQLVVGDIVILEAGAYVPADLRLIESVNLKADEAALTGESVPVEKDPDPIDKDDVVIGDRKNMAYLASTVTYGRGEGVVVKTGMDTEVGKIAGFISTEVEDETPLQRKLAEMGKYLSIIIISICVLVFIVGVLWGKEAGDMFLTAVSLAVAAIPEGLPAVVTIVLALGVQRMAKHNAIIRKLPAVETLGSTGVICSDKTGTLTQNKMTVTTIYINNKLHKIDEVVADSFEAVNLFKIATLCNDSKVANKTENGNEEHEVIGEPTETALIHFTNIFGRDKNQMETDFPRHGEIPFDSERKLMTTVNKTENGYSILTKGAVDVIIRRSDKILINGEEVALDDNKIQDIYKNNEIMAGKALRVLGFAYRELKEFPAELSSDKLEEGLTFVGLVGMIDPPRQEVKEAVRICKDAGIRPVMITGDHKLTAVAIAKELGIQIDDSAVITGAELDKISDEDFIQLVKNYSVYARVSPEHKVRIVKAWKQNGEIVAMTGDGVNDAPALKSSDIGIGMGITGTDVSKGVSDMVLTDDNFATIVSAVKEGRGIFSNIRKCVQFLLSCNMSEILTILIATVFNWQVLYPIHILWINLVTDTFPALALGVERSGPNIMKQKPRSIKQSIFSDGVGTRIISHGVIITIITLGAFLTANKLFTPDVAITITFMTLGFVQLFHAFNVRSNSGTLFNSYLFSNKYLWVALVIAALMQSMVVLFPFMNNLFRTEQLSVYQWLIALSFSLTIIPIVEIGKLVRKALKNSKTQGQN